MRRELPLAFKEKLLRSPIRDMHNLLQLSIRNSFRGFPDYASASENEPRKPEEKFQACVSLNIVSILMLTQAPVALLQQNNHSTVRTIADLTVRSRSVDGSGTTGSLGSEFFPSPPDVAVCGKHCRPVEYGPEFYVVLFSIGPRVKRFEYSFFSLYFASRSVTKDPFARFSHHFD